jgi:Rho-binding antiterminator
MISCHLYDYIEIACMYGFRVRLYLNDGSIYQGKAVTTQISPDKQEWLILQQDDETQRVQLEHIKTMQALTTNPHFDQVEF